MKRDYVENRDAIEFQWHGNLCTLAPGKHLVGFDSVTRSDGVSIVIDSELAGHLNAKFGSGIAVPQLRRYAEAEPILDTLLESVREGRERE